MSDQTFALFNTLWNTILNIANCFFFFYLINRKPFQCKSTIVWPQQTRKVIFSSFIRLPTCLMIAIQFKCKWVLLLFLLLFHFIFFFFFSVFFWFDFPGHLLAIFKAASQKSIRKRDFELLSIFSTYFFSPDFKCFNLFIIKTDSM